MYNFAHSLGSGDNAQVLMLEDSNLAISVISDELYPIGTVVKLVGDKSVEAVSGIADAPFGIVVTSQEKNGVNEVTVQTPFQAIVKGVAAGILTAGGKVAANNYNSANKVMVYAPAGGNTAVGIVLQDAADTEEVLVGILKSF